MTRQEHKAMDELKARVREVLEARDQEHGAALASLIGKELDECWAEDPQTSRSLLQQDRGLWLLYTALDSLADKLFSIESGVLGASFERAVCGQDHLADLAA